MRSSSGRRPSTRSKASCARRTAGASGGISPAGAAERRSISSSAPVGGGLAEDALEGRGDLLGVLPGREPDGDVGLGKTGSTVFVKRGSPPWIPFTSTAGAGERAQVEIVGSVGVHGPGARLREHDRTRVELLPRADLLLGGRDDARAQLVWQRRDRVERLA